MARWELHPGSDGGDLQVTWPNDIPDLGSDLEDFGPPAAWRPLSSILYGYTFRAVAPLWPAVSFSSPSRLAVDGVIVPTFPVEGRTKPKLQTFPQNLVWGFNSTTRATLFLIQTLLWL
jgi:hypothetical protein